MSIKFRKSFNFGGAKINLNANSVGISFGKKGMRYSINSKGRKTATAGIPGTGLYYTKTHGNNYENNQSTANENYNQPTGNKTCKKCGAVVNVTDKVCRNCGNKLESKSIPAIIWLILFFPVGLYIMWAKTDWNKIIKISVSSFFALCFLICIATGFSESDPSIVPESPISKTGITALTFLYKDDIELDLSSKVKNTKNSYFYVKGNDNFKLSDIEFISENPEIATIEYSKTLLTTNVYYDIKAVSPGETVVYVQTTDGLITSEKIKVIVTGEITADESTIETTTEPTTETTTKKKAITTTTTKKETTTKKVTTTETQGTRPEINQNYVINTSTKKFHNPNCYTIKEIKNNNLSQSTKSYDDLVKEGYSPCKKCLH